MRKFWPVLLSIYMGLALPALAQNAFPNGPAPQTPEVFAPGFISTNDFEFGGVYSPDMTEFYFLRRPPSGRNTLLVTKRESGVWRQPTALPFVGEPSFSPDGNTLHLGSRYAKRTAAGWSEPKPFDLPFGELPIMRLTVSSRGNYFFDQQSETAGIAVAKPGQQSPERLPWAAGPFAAHPFIAPDESFMIWDSDRAGGHGATDLYISFRMPDGTWGLPVNMGDKINTASSEMFASVSPDSKTLFFCRYENFDKGDIYWVDAKLIESLRPKR